MKKSVFLISSLLSLSLQAKVDMADPTAVYSSLGAEVNTAGVDMSVGVASGRHLALLESKDRCPRRHDYRYHRSQARGDADFRRKGTRPGHAAVDR